MVETIPSGTILHGRYRIERVLGSGGFGHVYLSYDLMTNQQCAVKEYLVTGAGGQEQLKHEARVLSQLHHPNLPAFMDTFMERGRYYVVLSYIDGNDLTDLVRLTRQRNEVIPIAQLLNWILSICDGVMFMHSQRPSVVHRDIKPDNIRITPSGTAVLVDLGNAKTVADGARTLFFIRHQGTPGYAPPEQYPGGTGTDARSDVYALGSTLYFALTATEPPSVSARNQSIQQGQPDLPTLQDHLDRNPPVESAEMHEARQFRLGVSKPAKPAPRHSKHIAQLGTLPPGILNTLNRITQKSMALRPNDRYQYVADFANDLKNVIAAFSKLPAATKSKDPNSTQPDLAEIYDALQNAKGQTNQPYPPNTPQPSSQPGGGVATMTCPRCQNPLAPNAAFCPRCGTPLRQPGNVMSNSAPYASVNVAQADKTQIISQNQVKQPVSTTAQRGSNIPPAMYTPQPEYQHQPAPQAQAMVMSSQSIQSPLNEALHPAPPQDTKQSNINPRLIIFGVIALLVVIIMIAFIYLNHG